MNFMWRSATWPSVTFYGLNGAKLFKHGDQSFLWMTFSPLWRIISLSSHTYGRKHPHIHKAHTHTHKEKRFHTASCCAESVPAMQPRGNGEVMGRAKIQLPTQPLICLCIPLSRWRGTRGATIHLSWFNIWLRLRLKTHVCVFKWK